MKKLWLLILILFGVLLVNAAEKVNLLTGSSYLIDNKNVSLIIVDVEDEVAVFCVNGVKSIVGEDRYKLVNGVGIDLVSVKKNKISASLTYRCRNGCECINCDNSVCFDKEEEENEIEESVTVDPGEIGVIQPEIEETYIEPVNIESKSVVIAVLIIVVLILGLVVLWKKG